MPISHDRFPEEAFKLVHGILSSRASASTFGLLKLTEAEPRTLSVAMPHRVELLDLRDVRRGTIHKSRRALAREKKRGECWRFLVLQELAAGADGGGGKQPTGFTAIAAATAVRAETGGFHFGGLNAGPFVAGTERAIRWAETTLSEVRERHFEATLLVVPALYVVALWLQDLSSRAADDQSGEADLLIAIPPSNPALEPGEPMLPASFLKALRRAS